MSSHLFRSKAANGITRKNPLVSTLTFAVDVVCLGPCGVISPGLAPGLLGVTGGGGRLLDGRRVEAWAGGGEGGCPGALEGDLKALKKPDFVVPLDLPRDSSSLDVQPRGSSPGRPFFEGEASGVSLCHLMLSPLIYWI